MRGRAVTTLLAALVLLAAAPTAVASPFEWRGVVEGPYGRPWDDGQRERVIRWMPAHGFNAYVHAPKDDLYQRTLWRDPYPADQMRRFAEEVRLARSLGVDWIPNLSPALPLIPTPAVPSGAPSRDLCFSCPADVQVVMGKFEPFVAAGARTLMVSFDDVSKVGTHPEDVVAFGPGDEGFGKANGVFLTKLLGAYRARGLGVRILTVGADYSGTADTDYLRGLRATLDPAVGVMWTGTGIASQDFTAADAAAYGTRIGRRPLVWDNWTNNDTAGNAVPGGAAARIFMGPYKRRPELAGAVSGFFMNPMNEADLNLLPLATAGDWMDDPGRYDRRASWLAAVRELAGGARAESLRAWAETSWSTKLDPAEAPTFVAASAAFLRSYGEEPFWPDPWNALVAELRLARGAGQALVGMDNGAFVAQARPWLDAARVAAGAGEDASRLLAAERPALAVEPAGDGIKGTVRPPDPDRAATLRSAYQAGSSAMKQSTRFVYGWRAGTAFEIPPYAVPDNVMFDYFDATDALDGAWQPRAQEAARTVRLEVDGRRVALGAGGSFSLPRERCARAELVATDGAGGRTGVRLVDCRVESRSAERGCLSRRARVRRGRAIGALRIGASAKTLARRAGEPRVRRRGVLRWCVRGGGTVAATLRRGRARALVTTAAGHHAGRLHPGTRTRSAAARRALRGSTRGLALLRRRGRVRALAVGRGTPAGLRRLARRALR